MAKERLKLLTETKDAWVGYAENSEVIATEFDKGEEEIKKVKKRFNLADANEDLRKGKTSLLTQRRPLAIWTRPSPITLLACASPFPKTRRSWLTRNLSFFANVSLLLKPSTRRSPRLRSLSRHSPNSMSPSRPLMPGWQRPPRNSTTSRTAPPAWPQKTELQEPWTCRKTLLPRLKSSRLKLPKNRLCYLKVMQFPPMLKISKMSSRGSLIMSQIFKRRWPLSVTSTPKMSNFGLSSRLASRSSAHGSLRPKLLPQKDFPNLLTWKRPKLFRPKSTRLTKVVLIISSSSSLPTQQLRR